VNEAFTRLTGYSLEEVKGKNPGHFLQFEGSDPVTIQRMREHLNAFKPIKCEVQNRSKDGHIYWLDLDIQPWFNENGECTGFFAVEFDITERKRTQQQLMDLNAQLHAEKTKAEQALEALKQAKMQLIQIEKMASLGVLTAGLAHEINNPINFISGGVQGLSPIIDDLLQLYDAYKLMAKAETEDEKAKALAEIRKAEDNAGSEEVMREFITSLLMGIQHGATRISDIVRSLQTFSNNDESSDVPIDIHSVLDKILLILHNQYKYRIEIVKNYAPQLPYLMGRSSQLSQAFMNIVSNAIEAIEGNGQITITTKQLDKEVEISVEDTGHGISHAIIDKIFDPFFTTKAVGKGTGLGLSIVHGVVERSGGRILVHSVEGKGTKMTVILPCQP
jgi:PAS domain S-box-containing protein